MKILWTDGSASPNPGPGGFAVLEMQDGKACPVCLGRSKQTTNIRMEGEAIVAAMEYAGEEGCEINTDSEFWINVLRAWAPMWKHQGWTRRNKPIANLDLVQRAYALYEEFPVELIWVRGHVGTEQNELADTWANRAREGVGTDNVKVMEVE